MGDGRRTAAAAVLGLAALLAAAPPPSDALGTLATAGSAADPTGPLVAAVALLAWALAGWLALTVVVVLLSRVPGLLGRATAALARRIAPATVRRAVEVALGLTVAVGVLGPTAAAAVAPVGGAAAVDAEAAWDLDWPSRAPAPTASTPPASTSAASTPTASAAPAPATVTVRPGDTLWSLAEDGLRRAGTARPTDRQVARAWPRWWAANRSVVGDDPDLLLPGTVLRPPPGDAARP